MVYKSKIGKCQKVWMIPEDFTMKQCGKETERIETLPNGDIIFVCDECAERAKMIKQKMDQN